MIKKYNPDVLNCLANLSNDEVFTSTTVVNDILDKLPKEIWSDKNVTFLDPCSKTGVFLREIVKRLNVGLKLVIPNDIERINHILSQQVFGMAITEITALISRRSVYCSKTANGSYSACDYFSSVDGNIRFRPMKHTWSFGNCIFCGANKNNYDRPEELESHAYEFIHTHKPEEVFNVKFDVIIGNPPYQLETGGGSAQATPLYHKFVEQAKKMNPRFISMIIPSRWFSGGMGLNEFRKDMMADKRMKYLVDFVNAKDCFPGVSIGGGVNYFLWERDYSGPCEITNVVGVTKNTMVRYLDEFSVIIRNNKAVSIIHKVNCSETLDTIVSAISPFGLPTYTRGSQEVDELIVHSSGGKGYISKSVIKSGMEYLSKYKVLLSANTSEHAGEPSKDGTFKVFATLKVLSPREVCTHSYILLGGYDSEEYAKNLASYLRTKFVRFLVLQTISGISISKEKFKFVPLQDFSVEWNDEKLYDKYELSSDEIEYIESTIKEMNGE